MCNLSTIGRRYALAYLANYLEHHNQFTAYDFYTHMRRGESKNTTVAGVGSQNHYSSGKGYFTTALDNTRIEHRDVASFLRELANSGSFPTTNIVGTTVVPGGPVVYFQMSSKGDVGRYIGRVQAALKAPGADSDTSAPPKLQAGAVPGAAPALGDHATDQS